MASQISEKFIAGIDEAGRGPLAGPVTAAAVVLPLGFELPGLADSKQLSAPLRDNLYRQIVVQALAYAVVSLGPREIERLNIRAATLAAMNTAAGQVLEQLCAKYGPCQCHFLVDGNMGLGAEFSSEWIIKGDQKEAAISAASILAKVQRDREMSLLHQRYPEYGFAIHKGYPTQYHRAQLAKLGPCVEHRRTFAGVKEMVQAEPG